MYYGMPRSTTDSGTRLGRHFIHHLLCCWQFYIPHRLLARHSKWGSSEQMLIVNKGSCIGLHCLWPVHCMCPGSCRLRIEILSAECSPRFDSFFSLAFSTAEPACLDRIRSESATGHLLDGPCGPREHKNIHAKPMKHGHVYPLTFLPFMAHFCCRAFFQNLQNFWE